MKVVFRQGKKLAKGSRMPDNPEHLARGAMPAQATLAPVAPSARQIDLTHNTLPYEARIVCRNNFTHELVSRRAGKSIVSAQKLEVGVADTRLKKPNDRMSRRPAWLPGFTNKNAMSFKMDRNHSRLAYHLRFKQVMTRTV